MDVNSASLRDLQQLPGVGCVTARLLVEARPFSALEHLLRVKGIGPVKYQAIIAHGQLYVGSPPSTDCSSTTRTPSRRKVELNSASVGQLQQLSGVGPVLAQRIVQARPFHRKEDLLGVSGIGPKSYVKMQAGVRVKPDAGPLPPLDGLESEGNTSEDDAARVHSRQERRRTQSVHICRELEQNVRDSVFLHTYDTASDSTAGNWDRRVLLVASWNIRNISRRKETPLLQRIAEVLDEFDLVALQEVRDTMVLKRLKTMLPGWDYMVSEPVGRHTRSANSKKRAEHFAFLYRRRMVCPTDKCELLSVTTDKIARAPFVGHFQATTHSGLPLLELTLVNVHVSFGEKEARHDEVAEINRLVNEVSGRIPAHKKVVVLGDFNLCPQDSLGSLGSSRLALVRSPLATTVFGKLYDNIWIDRRDFSHGRGHGHCSEEDKERDYLVDSGVLRIDWRHYPASKSSRLASYTQDPMNKMIPRLQTYMARVQCGYELSDHCPVWVAFADATQPDTRK